MVRVIFNLVLVFSYFFLGFMAVSLALLGAWMFIRWIPLPEVLLILDELLMFRMILALSVMMTVLFVFSKEGRASLK